MEWFLWVTIIIITIWLDDLLVMSFLVVGVGVGVGASVVVGVGMGVVVPHDWGMSIGVTARGNNHDGYSVYAHDDYLSLQNKLTSHTIRFMEIVVT